MVKNKPSRKLALAVMVTIFALAVVGAWFYTTNYKPTVQPNNTINITTTSISTSSTTLTTLTTLTPTSTTTSGGGETGISGNSGTSSSTGTVTASIQIFPGEGNCPPTPQLCDHASCHVEWDYDGQHWVGENATNNTYIQGVNLNTDNCRLYATN